MFLIGYLQAQIVTDGLVGYWPLDQGLENEQISDVAANINQAVLTTDRHGVASGAYSFDGVDDYIEYGDILDEYTAGVDKKFSISMWFYPADDSPSILMCKYAYCSGNRQYFTRFLNNKFEFTTYGTSSGTGARVYSTISSFTSSTWHHIVFVYDASDTVNNGMDRINIYVDGQLETIEETFNNGGAIGAIEDVHAHLTFGSSYGPSGACAGTQLLTGSLDEVCLYDKLLSASEVTTIYQDAAPVVVNNFAPNEFDILYTDAKVGINMPTVQQDFQLAVKGGIISDRVKVIAPIEWPDYVFEKDYELKGLEEVACYIEENHHLPDVPSANEVKAGGNDLGEMDAVLLKKIEELTLYLLAQQEQVEKQQEQINNQQKQIEAQQKALENLKRELNQQ